MLNDDLSHFARTIVCGAEPSAQIHKTYAAYSADVAIEVYRNNYRGNLHDALAGAYPVVKQLVGSDFFRFMAKRFIERHPPRAANLHHYGAELADFVADFEPAQELVYLSDVAALEWACHAIYFVDDVAALDIGKLTQIPGERHPDLVLHVNPFCRVVRSRYPIRSIWQAHQPGANGDFHIDLDSGPSIALVNRKADEVQVIELSEAEASWLQSIKTGVTLGAATDAALERHPDFDLQAELFKLVELDVLTDVSLGVTP
jgi:hypothetical protein